MSTYLRNSSILAFRYAIIGVIGFATVWLFSHYLSQETYGKYQFIMMLLALISFFSLPGLNLHALRATACGHDNAMWPTVLFSFRTSLLGSLVFFGLGIFYLITGSADFSPLLFLFLGVLFPFLYSPNSWYTYFEGKDDFYNSSLRLILLSVAVIFLTFLLLFNNVSLSFLIVGILLTQAVFHWYFLLRLPIQKNLEESFPVDIRFSVEASVQKLVSLLPDALPALLFPFFFSYEKSAVFQVGMVFFIAFSAFIGAISTVMLPSLFRGEVFLFKKNAPKLLLYGLVACLLYFATTFIFHEKMFLTGYEESTRLALLIAPLITLLPLRSMLIHSLTAKKLNNAVSFSLLISCFFAVFVLTLSPTEVFLEKAFFFIAALQISYFFLLSVSLYRFTKNPLNLS